MIKKIKVVTFHDLQITTVQQIQNYQRITDNSALLQLRFLQLWLSQLINLSEKGRS